jgi:cytochrome c oxidase assembly protein subunit 11
MKISRNNTVLASCTAVALTMLGLSYAAVPLYDMFCRATGYAGTPARGSGASGNISQQTITVSFDSNVGPALPWHFRPDQHSVDVAFGENKLAFFQVENFGDEAITGHASFNVTPARAARYFTKIECFCFTEQILEPGQIRDMPVSFFVDPELLNDRDAASVSEITLSYTFFLSQRGRTATISVSGGKG